MGRKVEVRRDDGSRTWTYAKLDQNAGIWSTAIPSSPAMDLMRMMVTDGYVVIGGGTSSDRRPQMTG
jgi:hypothetical protein